MSHRRSNTSSFNIINGHDNGGQRVKPQRKIIAQQSTNIIAHNHKRAVPSNSAPATPRGTHNRSDIFHLGSQTRTPKPLPKKNVKIYKSDVLNQKPTSTKDRPKKIRENLQSDIFHRSDPSKTTSKPKLDGAAGISTTAKLKPRARARGRAAAPKPVVKPKRAGVRTFRSVGITDSTSLPKGGSLLSGDKAKYQAPHKYEASPRPYRPMKTPGKQLARSTKESHKVISSPRSSPSTTSSVSYSIMSPPPPNPSKTARNPRVTASMSTTHQASAKPCRKVRKQQSTDIFNVSQDTRPSTARVAVRRLAQKPSNIFNHDATVSKSKRIQAPAKPAVQAAGKKNSQMGMGFKLG